MKKPLEEIAITEAKSFLKTVSDGLKILARGVENLAKQVDTLAEAQPEKPAGTAESKKTRPAGKNGKRRKGARASATDAVFRRISNAKKGISTETLAGKTGFDKKKIQNIVYRLKKQGKIKSAGKGIYEKA